MRASPSTRGSTSDVVHLGGRPLDSELVVSWSFRDTRRFVRELSNRDLRATFERCLRRLRHGTLHLEHSRRALSPLAEPGASLPIHLASGDTVGLMRAHLVRGSRSPAPVLLARPDPSRIRDLTTPILFEEGDEAPALGELAEVAPRDSWLVFRGECGLSAAAAESSNDLIRFAGVVARSELERTLEFSLADRELHRPIIAASTIAPKVPDLSG